MEFTRNRSGQSCELVLKGRLDAASSESLDKEIDEIVHSGGRHIGLDMGSVTYMSSAGIRSLLRNFKEFRKFGGSICVKNPSTSVSTVLKLTKLEALLSGAKPEDRSANDEQSGEQKWKKLAHDIPGLSCEIRKSASASPFRCVTYGDPGKLGKMKFQKDDMHSVRLDDDDFSIGIGAFGVDYEDCIGRFGEFIAVSGCAACLPSDDTKFPDFVSKKENLLPELKVLYSIGFKGEPSTSIRFETPPEKRRTGISDILGIALGASKTQTLGIVMVAESAGLVGASLKSSPVADGDLDFFKHPEIRSRLDFSPERIFDRSMVLVCGVVSMLENAKSSEFLRPAGSFSGKNIYGHLHAAVFSFHALPKSEIDLRKTVQDLFEDRKLLGLIHLICDSREISGIGESLFAGGVMWTGEITQSDNVVNA